MIGLARALWWKLILLLKSRRRLESENLALRHQVAVLRRSVPRCHGVYGSDAEIGSCSFGSIGCGRAF